MGAIDVFLRRILDYAGMFPPAKLPFDQALRQYEEYQHHPHADLLGRFVLPLGRMKEMAGRPWRLSALVAPGEIPDSLPAADSIEMAWNGDEALLARLAGAAPGEARIFLELDWRKPVATLMAKIAGAGPRFGVKLRTGGVSPEAVPPAGSVAEFLLWAAHHKLPVKATAGLHVPVPKFDATVGARMHGFLNFFCAGFLAFSGRGDRPAIATVIEDFGYRDFEFGARSLRCGEVEFSLEEIEPLRGWVTSFGSCSFIEPIEHLERHGLL